MTVPEFTNKRQSWRQAIGSIFHPRVMTMLFYGFSAGMPLLLIFSSLSLWLREAGVERSAVTFFSWAALGYSFKFVWAPLVDKLPLPILTRLLGRRRAWILTSQLLIITAIIWMSLTDPAAGRRQLTVMALAAVMLGFSAATQDIVIDAFRIESAGVRLQALLASAYIAGYRVGMLVAGAGALYLAAWFGSEKGAYSYTAWQGAYLVMAGAMGIGVMTTLLVPEPEVNQENLPVYPATSYLRVLLLFILAVAGFVVTFYFSGDWAGRLKPVLSRTAGSAILAGFVVEMLRLAVALLAAVIIGRLALAAGLVHRRMVIDTYIEPVRDFFRRYGLGLALLLLSLIGLYRISDIVLGVISNVFYQDLGFSKSQIAGIVKTFGLFMTIAGGFVGGVLSTRYGVMRMLFLGAILAAATNLLFMLLAATGYNLPLLYLIISADNLAAGLASAAFVAFLSGLTNVRFTAMQYAIFSSLMTLLPKMVGGYSGTMVDSLGYPAFFLVTALVGVPVLLLVRLAAKHLVIEDPPADGRR